jgi:hypothetical protein
VEVQKGDVVVQQVIGGNADDTWHVDRAVDWVYDDNDVDQSEGDMWHILIVLVGSKEIKFVGVEGNRTPDLFASSQL